MTDFQRKVELAGAYDKRHSDPKRNYGIHGMELRCYLAGPKATMQFIVYTNMHLPHVFDELMKSNSSTTLLAPMGADIGYHARKPQFMPTFLAGGLDVVWSMLEERYKDLFETSTVDHP